MSLAFRKKIKLYTPRLNYIDSTLNKIKGHLLLAGVAFDEDHPIGCSIHVYVEGETYVSRAQKTELIKDIVYLRLKRGRIGENLRESSVLRLDFSNENRYEVSFWLLLNYIRHKSNRYYS